MSDPKPPLITRKDAALYFANATLLYSLATSAFFGTLLILAQRQWDGRSEIWHGTALWLGLQGAVCLFPFMWFIGLLSGEQTWRYCYDPDPLFFRFYNKARWFVSIPLGALAYFGMWVGFATILAFTLITQFHFFRFQRAIQQRLPVGRFSPKVVLLIMFAFQLCFILEFRVEMGEYALVISQLISLGLVNFYMMFSSVNTVSDWIQSGRLPAEGNWRFQIPLQTTLLIVIGVALWAATVVWILET